MHIDTNNTITGSLTGRSARYTDRQSRRDAIAQVEKLESARQAELEKRLGRSLTPREIANGGIEHEERRDKRELLQREMTVREQPQPTDNPRRAAANYLRSTLEQKNLGPRERAALEAERDADEWDAERKAEAKAAAIANDPRVQEAAAALRDFVVDIKFSPCDVATVERAEELLAKVERGETLDTLEVECAEIKKSIHDQVFAERIADAQAALERLTEQGSFFDVNPESPTRKVADPWADDVDPYDPDVQRARREQLDASRAAGRLWGYNSKGEFTNQWGDADGE